ncbi:4Fe-4S dicluster domain-containing protein [Desulfosporosinus sp. FKA]|uniref:4Fe-4S dicluster domain-containing protein n=1 Tax=Desulfosporosinus sp. FKA TaxID=1969834 RepID=UPI000B4A3E90|nr:4Fe-4S dicluster domain-containing protein [Desulfosporosinus sp. FKA]
MKQMSFLVDVNLCLGCRSCQMACAANRGLARGVFWRKVNSIEYVNQGKIIKYYLTSACYQCENPECIRLCPQKAYRKRQDGIVILDSAKCNGCGICIHACPFEAPVRDPETGLTGKCDYCYTLLDRGLNPYCIDACPVQALHLLEKINGEETTDSTIVKILPGVPKIQLTRPSVRYRRLNMGRQIMRFPLPRRKEGFGGGGL